MKLLLDTHLLLGAAAGAGLSSAAAGMINDPDNQLFFSAANIWEVAIKSALGRPDFDLEAGVFRRALLDVYTPRYGDDWEQFLDSGPVYARIEPERMFTFSMPEA